MHKKLQWITALALVLASPALYALGLGSAKVNSFLNQPLDVRVELISQSSEELQSVTAKLASARDFELLGLKLNAISVPLDFEVVTDGGNSYIHISSDLKVSSPVMQVLVEVVWSNGRMLREYTLFLDPPTIDSKAPAPQAPKPVVATPATSSAAPPAVADVAPQQAAPEVSAPQPSVSQQSVAVDAAAEPQSDAVTESSQDSNKAEGTQRVGKGQTLWGIASDWSQGTGYGVNQTMLAIQRNNPDAFINDNINYLKQGEILRMPSSNEMAEISNQQAALEVQRQATGLSPSLSGPDFNTPTVADSGDFQESYQDDQPENNVDAVGGRLEIVPPAEGDLDAVGAISQASDDVTAANVEGQVLQEKLTRAEEDLINAELENSYLKDRIAALEEEAAAAEDAQKALLEDAALAAMESAMAEQQASDEPEAPVAITPGGEQQPWYAGVTIWLIAGLVFLVLLVVWFLRRRSRLGSESWQDMESKATVQAVTDDAEDLLDILDNYGEGTSTDAETAPIEQTLTDYETDSDTVVEPVLVAVPDREAPDTDNTDFPPLPSIELPDGMGDQTTEVVEVGDVVDFEGSDFDKLDDEDELALVTDDDRDAGDTVVEETEEANDPELKLDLARAYLSLGDKEAARSMLDEVMLNGNEDQVAEAEQMLDEL